MATATVGDRQEYTFQAEIKQLLHLLSHSLYQSREIAVRELISNASDALDKMRYVSLTDESQREAGALEIVIEGREGDNELVVRDTGIGMTHDELVANLGTIARSGSAEFLKAMTAESAESKPDVSLIGQFGVGFYSAFMIADKRAGADAQLHGGIRLGVGIGRSGSFTVTPAEGPLPRGTEVILHLKDDAKDFAVGVADPGDRPALLQLRPLSDPAGEGGEVLNDQKPIWVEPKSQVTEEQYTRFYQHLTHHPDEKPLWHLHLAADSPIQFRAIVYCPPTNLERLGLLPARARAEPLCQAGAGAVRVPRAGARVPPVPPRTGRFRGPAAERLARDAPGQQRHPPDPHLDRQGRARPARQPRAGGRRGVTGPSTASSARCSRRA